ncbi:HlyD family efflux transporter periplasmic adaptor subunit [Catenuloplanes sp. NPDC051500]|uniref:efflux RND transporter periplasmic adaptor subunit n=1 Tax=Catenuloplanes sp. NPDC051500 TaxID=3363959 RepID=UPI00379E8E54
MVLRGRRMRVAVGVAAAVVVAGASTAYALTARDEESTAKTSLVAVETGDVTLAVAATGTLAPASTRSLSFGTSSTVTAVNVRTGDVVKAGDVLAEVDPADAQEKVDKAAEELAAAQEALSTASSSSSSTGTSCVSSTGGGAVYSFATTGTTPTTPTTPTPSPSPSTTTPAGGDPVPAVTVTVTETVTVYVTVPVTASPTESPSASPSPSASATPSASASASADPTPSRSSGSAPSSGGGTNGGGSNGGGSNGGGTNGGGSTGGSNGGGTNGGTSSGGTCGTGTSSGSTTGTGTSVGGTTGGGSTRSGGSGDAVYNAQTKVTSAQVALDEAEDALAGAVIKAPIGGKILSVAGGVGTNASAGSTFLSLGDIGGMEVQAAFPEADAGRLEVGQIASVTLADRPGETFAATVTQVDPVGTATDSMVTYGALISFDTVPEDLLVGQNAQATVTVSAAAGVLRVPASAVRDVTTVAGDTDRAGVVTVRVNGVDEQRTVRVGLVGDAYAEITSGVAAGETVVAG